MGFPYYIHYYQTDLDDANEADRIIFVERKIKLVEYKFDASSIKLCEFDEENM